MKMHIRFGAGSQLDDYDQSLQWHRRSAEQEYAPAYNSIGLMYHLGLGVSQDNVEAVTRFRQAR